MEQKRGTLNAEHGRSMVETLGVLAIIGILSVVAVAGFKALMNKHRANAVVNDSKMVYMDAHARQSVPDTDWHDVSYRFESGKSFQVMRDKKQNDYVKANGIEKAVCVQVLNMATKNVLAFFNEDYTEMTSCDNENNIVVAWNGLGAPAECEATSDCDVGEYAIGEESTGFPGFCNGAGRCQACDPEFEEVNDDRTGCICDSEKALSCSDGETDWCCGDGLICDPENKGCKDGGGKCTLYFYEADDTTEYTTNCSYSLSSESNVEYYYSDCYYDIGSTAATANMTTEDIGNTSRTYDKPSVTGHGTRGGCPANKYCALFWQGATPNPENANQYVFASKPSTTTNNGLTGFLYGRCQTLSGYDSTPLTQNKTGSGMMVGIGTRGGCPENQYCALMWKQENWTGTTEPKLENGDKDQMYGKCQTLSGYDTTPLITEDSNFTQYRMGQGCPAGQYCRILWVKGTCTGAQNGDKGEFSGTCISMSPPTPGTINCPY